MAAEFLRTDNPNLHSAFPQHHAASLPAERQGSLLVKAVEARRGLQGIKAFDPKPGQAFLVTATGTRPR